jgi:hypothetical protein
VKNRILIHNITLLRLLTISFYALNDSRIRVVILFVENAARRGETVANPIPGYPATRWLVSARGVTPTMVAQRHCQPSETESKRSLRLCYRIVQS